MGFLTRAYQMFFLENEKEAEKIYNVAQKDTLIVFFHKVHNASLTHLYFMKERNQFWG